MSANEIPLPQSYWNAISQDDRNEYLRLRQSFHHGQKISSKDRRIVTFRKELNIVLHYLERSTENMEARCVLTGVCFAGPVICVNTRQLKSFLSRCKSSINGSFQQLGYVALRTKAKARNCVVSVLPSLQNQQNILRQWTVRVASDDAQFCFLSSFSNSELPEITEDDLFDEKKPLNRTRSAFTPMQSTLGITPPTKTVTFGHILTPKTTYAPLYNNNQQGTLVFDPLKPKPLDYELQSLSDYDPNDFSSSAFPSMSTSFSMDCFKDYDQDWDNDNLLEDNPMRVPYKMNLMKKSPSASVRVDGDFDFIGDDFNFHFD